MSEFVKITKKQKLEKDCVLYYKFGHRIEERNMAECKLMFEDLDYHLFVYFRNDIYATMKAKKTHFFIKQ